MIAQFVDAIMSVLPTVASAVVIAVLMRSAASDLWNGRRATIVLREVV